MNIAGMSMVLSQAKVQQAASLSVMKMAMGNAKQNGNAVKEMLEGSSKALEQVASPHVGKNVDVSA